MTLLGSKDSMGAWQVSHLMSTKPDTQDGVFGVMVICGPGTNCCDVWVSIQLPQGLALEALSPFMASGNEKVSERQHLS